MTDKEAIRELETLAKYFDDHVPAMGGDALRMGAAALARLTLLEERLYADYPASSPLTLKELQDIGRGAVWVVLEGEGFISIHDYALVDAELEVVRGLHFVLSFEDYGNGGWLAYRRKPEDDLHKI